MKSKVSIIIILLFAIFLRISINISSEKELNILTYDAFGYYLYLPAIFIYNDLVKLKWIDELDQEYHLTGGKLYQANKAKNNNYVIKYFCGTAILQAPFFVIANSLAEGMGFTKNGFSKPYQVAIVIASIFYFLVGLIFLRLLLLKYFEDSIVSLILIAITLATNLMQYVSIDSGMTHSYLFFVYCLILCLTDRVHETPNRFLTLLLGVFCGLAIVIRPTEAICVLIPILWKAQFLKGSETKFSYLKRNPSLLFLPIIGGLLLILPQIVYWKLSSGSYIYNVGSKWVFLNPFFRVLFGFEKGWFIYTPIALIFIFSLLKIKNKPFEKSVLVFVFLNTWIIISWFDWRYGASFSTRALCQSYPVLALSFGCLLAAWPKKIQLLKGIIMCFMFLNIFQLYQYNKGVLHFNDMNRKYYSQIFFKSRPNPLDFSLLDTQIWLDKNKMGKADKLFESNEKTNFITNEIFKSIDVSYNVDEIILKSKLDILAPDSFWQGRLVAEIWSLNQVVEKQSFRLNRPLAKPDFLNTYEFYSHIPFKCIDCKISYKLETSSITSAFVKNIEVISIKVKK